MKKNYYIKIWLKDVVGQFVYYYNNKKVLGLLVFFKVKFSSYLES